MDVEINCPDVNIKEENFENENGLDDSCKSNGFLYIDMNNYSENNFEGIDIKEEEEQVDDLLTEKNSFENNDICLEGNLPLNSLRNLANHSQNDIKVMEIQTIDKIGKKKGAVLTKPLLQKENISLKTNVSDGNGENSKSRRYALRARRTWTQEINSGLVECISYRKKNIKLCKKAKIAVNIKSKVTNLGDNIFVSDNSKKESYVCFKCKTCFSSNILFNAHIKNCKGLSSKDNEADFSCKSSVIYVNQIISERNLQNHEEINYKCNRCKRNFKNKKNLASHILKNECSAEIYICALCNQNFFKKNILKKHMIAHLENQIQCKYCFQSYTNSNSHICVVNMKTSYTYCECIKSFLESNRKEIQNIKTNNKCLQCNKPVMCKKYDDNHLPSESYSALSHCQICKENFEDSVSYNMHLESHRSLLNSATVSGGTSVQQVSPNEMHNQRLGTVKKKIRYKCDTCGKLFIKLVKLKIHILNVHQGISYHCKRCNVKFPSQEDLDSHTSKNECKSTDLCTCKTCGKVFAKRDYLKKHQYVHMNVLFKCKYCYCAFMKEKSYKKHIEKMNCSKSARKIRMAEFNYRKCRLCSMEYETEEELIKHFRVLHIGLEPHQCFCCDSFLPTFQELQNHIHQHNIQKYTCNLCGKPYTSQEGFRKHRLKHKGAEFKCRFCFTEFLNENRFKFHEKICKKNPESSYEPSQKKENVKKKDSKPKQSRQLHWESRIIMKRLRGDPSLLSGDQKYTVDSQQDNFAASTFFDEPESEVTNERGWFDNYYKTEEDDIAFGLRKPEESALSDCNSGPDLSEFLQKDSVGKNKISAPPLTTPSAQNSDSAEERNNSVLGADNYLGSSSEDSSTESESEIESTNLPIDYNPKKCRLCIISFGQEYELLHHFIKSHPGEFAHKCPQCEIQSPLYAQLKEHMKTHGIGIGIYNCDNCSKQFKSEKKLSSHNIRCKGINNDLGVTDRRSASQPGDDVCKRCGKKFHTKFGYRRHKQICKKKKSKNLEKSLIAGIKAGAKEENVNTTAEDDFQFSDPETDSIANNKTSEKPTAAFKKNSEGTKLSSSDIIKLSEVKKIEMNTFSGEPPVDSFPCRLCDKKFQYERGIVMHFKTAHPGNKPLICHVCNMYLADKLKEHLKTHGIGEEFICELCGKRFNQKFLSKIHEMWHQGIEYKCNNCKQKFLNKEKMDKHIGEDRCRNRQSLMRLPCDICGKSYRSKFGLSKHYITHTPKELRPVKNRMNCEYCGKWFENNNGLQRHRRIHTGERPFCCRFCPKAFAQEGNCKAHERIHTGESKPRKKKHSAETEPPSQMPPSNSVISHVSAVPSFSLSTSEPATYPTHINMFNFNSVESSGIVN